MLLFRYSAYRFQKNNNICEYVGSLQRRYVPTDLQCTTITTDRKNLPVVVQ